MTRHLFLITIGPVQEFIAGARRTRDLWFGSWLLSELARTAAQSLHGRGATLIFPPPDVIGRLRSDHADVANKILVQIDGDPQKIAEQVINTVRDRLKMIWSEAQKSLHGAISAYADAQIDDLLEIYWAAAPLGDDYATARRQVEALVAARKTTRDFTQVTWGDTVPKSSIDGQRESVIAEEQYPKGFHDPQRQQKIDDLYKNYRAGKAERLSAVDLLKRHGQAGSRAAFPSTADIAVRSLLKRLEGYTNEARTLWNEYIKALGKIAGIRLEQELVYHQQINPILGDYDGGLLLESRLAELIDTSLDQQQARTAQQQARAALSDFYAALKTLDTSVQRLEPYTSGAGNKRQQLRKLDAGVQRPEPYYAILLADGDRMGATINAQTDQQRHIELSQRLATFAGEARRIIEQNDGALIYAGGDDVLAFVPLHYLVRCARTLHDRFAASINPNGSSDFCDGDKPPTLSVGIAICHQLEPLSDALDLARKAEKAAKAVIGKDALAITLSKRSGADVTISGKWGELDPHLNAFTAMHRDNALPDGAAFQLRDLAERLTPKGGDPTIPPSAVLAEARRILKRKQAQHGTVSVAKETIDGISMTAISAAQSPKTALQALRGTADTLIVARLLATAAEHANLPTEEKL